ncbi:hypothetical protein ACFL4T_09230 [candidate division KSB1 bacterium]
MGSSAYFWSCSEIDSSSYYRYLYYGNSFVYRNYRYKYYGFSVRCVKD